MARHTVIAIDPDSIGEELGVAVGDALLSINGEPVIDIVDYEYHCANERLTVTFETPEGEQYEAEIEKDETEPLGLTFAGGLVEPMRSCKNHCIFCFIDQMPKGVRPTLAVKDDDWRMSFIMGNYITLTNVNDEEFNRILKRRVSPLYVSVHATAPDVRVRMMRNPTAGRIMERLRALYDAGLSFHCQIVCCPGVNDGAVLRQTLADLYSLYPAACSVAVVPVGLTKYRDALTPLRPFTKEEAKKTLEDITAFAEDCKHKCGTAFAFASDEFYIIAKEPLPPANAYEDYPQIENGVGLLRLFEEEFMAALNEHKPLSGKPLQADVAGGVAAESFFKQLYEKLVPYGMMLHNHAVVNDYFGHTVHVGGLVTGGDIVKQLQGALKTGTLLIPENMLREQEDVFLDGYTVEQLSQALGVRVIPMPRDGAGWITALYALADEQGRK
ncbi:MAG: DUF512 domain-containing protein [Eubacteriales bacterium]|nr:DUF512 domain-containing protein [Eubacteriales bacterium]